MIKEIRANQITTEIISPGERENLSKEIIRLYKENLEKVILRPKSLASLDCDIEVSKETDSFSGFRIDRLIVVLRHKQKKVEKATLSLLVESNGSQTKITEVYTNASSANHDVRIKGMIEIFQPFDDLITQAIADYTQREVVREVSTTNKKVDSFKSKGLQKERPDDTLYKKVYKPS